MNYKDLLEHSFEVEKSRDGCPPESRLAYLSDSVFNFTTYDSEMDELFATKAVEVCAAINDGTTFDYIQDAENYRWYLLMCNMPFFAERLEWGTSIRGAWWSGPPGQPIEFQSCGLWDDDDQLADTIEFEAEEWKKFTRALVEFAAPEMKPDDAKR